MRGTDFYRGTIGSDVKGTQVDVFAGLTRRITPNLVVGVLGGYEHFDYSSQAFNGVLKGDGWTAGAQKLVFEPSARVCALWQHENAYTDSLGTPQPARNFETGRASAGIKAIYPLAWTSSVALAPYAGLYADYYFSRDDGPTDNLTTLLLLQGWSARVTGGVTATLAGGASLGAGGELGGIGSVNHIWSWTVRGRLPF